MQNKQHHIGLLILRISIAFTMLIYGISKLIHGIDFITETLIQKGLPGILGYGIYVGEIIAPILIILGYRAKLAGLVFAINSLTAILLVQLPNLFKLNEFGGWAISLLFIYFVFGLSIFLTGAGKFAISRKNKWD